MNLTPEQRAAYAAEALRRKGAIDSFSAYRRFVREDYEEWPYVTLINEKLESVFRGDCKRLMLFMPPQHGKTWAVSEDFPSYCIGKNPKLSIVGTAFNSERAADYGEAVRDQVKSPEFKLLFPKVHLSEDSQAKNRWNVTVDDRKRGGYFAAGVNTALTGRKGDIMIIDDPFKDREDANSELRREAVWNWYHTVFRKRRSPDASLILVMTRWHDDDLAGRILETDDRWEVLKIPAKATEDDDILGRKEGEYLSETPNGGSRFPKEYYEEEEATTPPFDWSALMQQEPTPDDGILFLKEDFREHNEVPWGSKCYVVADLSYSDKSTADSAVITAWYVAADGIWYLDDLWRKQSKPDEIAEMLATFCADHEPDEVVLEKIDETHGGALINRVFDERGVRTPIQTVSAAGDKVSKATNYRGQVARGRVSVKKAPWRDDFINEHLRFPNGKNDDQVDVGSALGRRMDGVRIPKVKAGTMRYHQHTGQNIIDMLQAPVSTKTRLA